MVQYSSQNHLELSPSLDWSCKIASVEEACHVALKSFPLGRHYQIGTPRAVFTELQLGFGSLV